MELDDEVCLCFHVTKRKVLNYLRVEKPRRAGQLSDCFGAGTGCGWCRGLLERYFQATQAGGGISGLPATDQTSAAAPAAVGEEPTLAEHAARRAQYIRAGKGTPPPGATPLADPPPGAT